ncbi:MAG: lipid II:glycine glycyltransferase FemX [Anaerolineae bacterium]
MQPPRTVLIDVDDAPDAIMARMNQSTRRKIRLSDRRDVAIRRGDSADVAVFSQLAEITGERNDFGVHSEAYHQMAFDLFAPDHAVLLMASYEGQDLAGLMAFQWGDRAYYLYGASSSKERNRMPTYGLQWAAMEWAREKGCTVYDMWGIPDADEEILEAEFQERRDGLWGVYGFKRGFGGRVVRSVGAWDKVYNPAVYAAYRLVLRAREAL